MHLVYAEHSFPDRVTKSIFLAGPTPRSELVESWRGRAVEILQAAGYDGTVYIPEPSNGKWRTNYDGQVLWEQGARLRADRIVFWVPRDIAGGMPAFTTNVEFGADYTNGRSLYGRPDGAEKIRYLDVLYTQETGSSPYTSLESLLDAAITELGAGATRHGVDASIPLDVWKHPEFQRFRSSCEDGGRKILAFQTNDRAFWGGSPCALRAKVTIEDAGTIKTSYVVLRGAAHVSV